MNSLDVERDDALKTAVSLAGAAGEGDPRMFEDVEFASQGARLRGRLYRPSRSGPAPVVVMAHGTSATITMTTDRYAEVFRAAGFAVLLYDHRNFGASGGEPRQEINPWVQARGYRDAITFVESAPGIAPDAIAIWGDSYSAAEVIVVGAVDERPAAVVAQVPAMGPQLPPPTLAARRSRPSGTRCVTASSMRGRRQHRPAAGGLRRPAQHAVAAHADPGVQVVHRVRRAVRHRMAEPGEPGLASHAMPVSRRGT
jgi:alpha-beta hydrolase superfamily lysophospholipase